MTAPAKQPKRRPPDRARRAAADVLLAVYEGQAYANLSLRDRLDALALSPLDRRFATALVYETITRTVTCDWLINQVSSRPVADLDPRVRVVLRMGVWQLVWSRSVPARAAVDESVRLTRAFAGHAATGFVNGVLRRLAREPVRPAADDAALQLALPRDLYACLQSWLGPDEAWQLGQALLAPQTHVTLRVNRRRTSREAVLDALSQAGFDARPGRYLPEAIHLVLAGHSVASLPPYQAGLVSVQDEAAMLVGLVAGDRPQGLVMDCCAAPGGKTAHLIERHGPGVPLVACDLHENRLALVNDQLARLGLGSVKTLRANAMDPLPAGTPDPLAAYDGQAGLVLMDVPCSGLGLLGRKPEIRLTMTPRRMQAFEAIQAALLNRAVRLARPGGRIVYSTCTLNPAENQDQVQALLARFPGLLEREPLTDDLPPALLAHADLASQARSGWLQLLPHRHGTDGFFMARLRKKGEGT